MSDCLIQVNGRMEALPYPQTLDALLRTLAPQAPYSVARNGEFVPRAHYAVCPVCAGDSIEIVQATAGG